MMTLCAGVQAFDELLLMKIGGQVIYGGELGTRSNKLVSYFEVSLPRCGTPPVCGLHGMCAGLGCHNSFTASSCRQSRSQVPDCRI